jgi:hypothetical protein
MVNQRSAIQKYQIHAAQIICMSDVALREVGSYERSTINTQSF